MFRMQWGLWRKAGLVQDLARVQGFLEHKKQRPLGLYMQLCLGPYGGPRGVGFF